MIHINCPGCSANLILDAQPQIGWLVDCTSCKRTLEVVWLYPLELGFSESQEHGVEMLFDGNIQAS